jgi:hypothetical protein
MSDPKSLPPIPPVPLLFNAPSRGSITPPPELNLSGAPKNLSALPDFKYPLPDVSEFTKLLDDPAADVKDLNHQLTRLMGQTAILLLQEAHTKAPSFNRAQTASRVVEALRSLHMTVQEREKNLYKDRLDFDNPRLQYLIDGLWDLIESVMRDCKFNDDQINNFFLMLQSRLPTFEEETKKKVNAVSFSATKYGAGAERSESATLVSKKRDKTLNGKTLKGVVLPPTPPTADDHT